MTSGYTADEFAAASTAAQRWLADLDADDTWEFGDPASLQAIIVARREAAAAEDAVRAAIDAGRAAGMSWAAIGFALGAPSEAARAQFHHP